MLKMWEMVGDGVIIPNAGIVAKGFKQSDSYVPVLMLLGSHLSSFEIISSSHTDDTHKEREVRTDS